MSFLMSSDFFRFCVMPLLMVIIIQADVSSSFAFEKDALSPPLSLQDEDFEDRMLREMVEESLKKPDVPPIKYSLNEIISGLQNADTNFIIDILKFPHALPWLEYALKQMLTMDPPIKFQQFFLTVIAQLNKNHLLVQLFYDALEKIDPAKAGLILLDLIGLCERPKIQQQYGPKVLMHLQILTEHLLRVTSLWKLDVTNRPFLMAFFKAKLMDRIFLKQVNIWPTESGHICLRNEEVGTVFEIRGDTAQNLLRIGAEGLDVAHLSFVFSDDMIPYIEALLKLDDFFFPFRKMMEREIARRKSFKPPSASDLNFSQWVSLYGFTVDRGKGVCNLKEYLRKDSPKYTMQGRVVDMIVGEAIVVQHRGLHILLKPSFLPNGTWNQRRSPYEVIGFVDGENLYPLGEEDRLKIQRYLSNISAEELTHFVVFDEAVLLDKKDIFVDLSISGRGEIYEGHDLALENEVKATLSQVVGPVSVVDVGMGAGELVERLANRFAADSRVRFYGAEPDPRLRQLASLRIPNAPIADVAGQKLSRAFFIQSGLLNETYRIAIVEGVIACGVTDPVDGEEILLELFKIGFEKIFMTANTPVNLNFERLSGRLERFGYRLERTLYPQNLFNMNLPKVMFVLSKIEKERKLSDIQSQTGVFDLAA